MGSIMIFDTPWWVWFAIGGLVIYAVWPEIRNWPLLCLRLCRRPPASNIKRRGIIYMTTAAYE